MEFDKISSIQNVFMVPENAFPAFKPVALAGKVAAKHNIGSVIFSIFRIFDGFHRNPPFEDFPQFLRNTVFPLHLAATFPARATVLNAGNTFFGTIQKFCTEEI